MILTSKEIKLLCQEVAKAGEEINRIYHTRDLGIHYKAGKQPVTKADLLSNNIIINFLEQNFSIPVLSEELYTDDLKVNIDKIRRQSEYLWVLDPLDGTNDFIKGHPHFSISLGLLKNNQPVFGIIYNPMTQTMLHGGVDYGFFKNNEQVKKSLKRIEHLSDLKVCYSRSECKIPEVIYFKNVLNPKNIMHVGSIAYKMYLVACGEYDLIVSRKPKYDWDIAAGAAFFKHENFLLMDIQKNNILFNLECLTTKGVIGGDKRPVEMYFNYIDSSSFR